jgi:hypothetical protein
VVFLNVKRAGTYNNHYAPEGWVGLELLRNVQLILGNTFLSSAMLHSVGWYLVTDVLLQFFLDVLTLEEWADRLSWSIANQLQPTLRNITETRGLKHIAVEACNRDHRNSRCLSLWRFAWSVMKIDQMIRTLTGLEIKNPSWSYENIFFPQERKKCILQKSTWQRVWIQTHSHSSVKEQNPTKPTRLSRI